MEEQVKKTFKIYQNEFIQFLLKKFDIQINQSTISRELKRLGLFNKTARRVSSHQNQALRRGWRAQMTKIRAEQLVFLNEISFNERSGWRRAVYAFIDHDGRY